MRLLLFLLFFFSAISIFSQVEDHKDWCRIVCDPDINKENTELIYKLIQSDSIKQALQAKKPVNMPLRFVYVDSETVIIDSNKMNEIEELVTELNVSFKEVKFNFYTESIEQLNLPYSIEDLAGNQNFLYDDFSTAFDKEDIITVFLMNHANEFCTVTPTSIRCSKTGGFSYILSNRTNNLVLSRFDYLDPKIVAHEFGHFFGLYHTFERNLFGSDMFENQDCYLVGDRICDTPPDPGSVFEVHVNYTKCEMVGFKDSNNEEFKPIINNYMSYYKPCYLKPYVFTPEQIMVMQLASQTDIRKKFIRE